MNNRNGRKILGMALVATLALSTTALMAQTSGGHGGGSGGSTGSGHRGGGGHSGGGSSHGHGGSGYRGHYRGHSGGYYGGYYGGYIGVGAYGWGYPGYGYYGGSGWYGPPAWGYTSVYPAAGAAYGALDLDVSPEGAQIYVDGNLVGVADDFDGYPNFLWLDKGTYDVVIFAPGFQTISRQYSIYGGLVIDVEDSMVPGKETLPQDLVSKQNVNREERLRRDRENEAEARAYEEAQGRGAGAPDSGAVAGEDADPERLDARGEPGSLKLEIEPGDASVYLDGRFLGTGRELARLRSGLIVDPGQHRIEVVRPGRRSETQTFSVTAGEEVSVDIELDEE